MIGLFSNKDFQNAHPEFNFHRTYILTSSSKIGELSGEIDSNFDISGIIYIGKNEDKLNFENQYYLFHLQVILLEKTLFL